MARPSITLQFQSALLAIVLACLLTNHRPTLFDLALLVGFVVWWLSPKAALPRWPSLLLLAWLALELLSLSQPLASRDKALQTFLVDLGGALAVLGLAGVAQVQGPLVLRASWMGLSIAALISVLACIATWFGWLYFPKVIHLNIRWEGFLHSPNYFGALVVVAACATGFLGLSNRGVLRWVWFGLVPLFILAVILSYSRGAWLNLVLVAALLVVLGFVGLRQWLTVLIMGGLGIAILVYPFLDQPNVLRLLKIRAGLQAYDTQRVLVYKVALRYSAQHPWGIGLGQTPYKLGDYVDNFYLIRLLEGGWLSFVAILAFIFLTLARLLQKIALNRARAVYVLLFALMIGMLVNGFVNESSQWRFQWLVWALAWGNYDPPEPQPELDVSFD